MSELTAKVTDLSCFILFVLVLTIQFRLYNSRLPQEFPVIQGDSTDVGSLVECDLNDATISVNTLGSSCSTKRVAVSRFPKSNVAFGFV